MRNRFDPLVGWTFVYALVVGLGFCASPSYVRGAQASPTTPTTNSSATPAYAGSSSCRECHARFYELWAPSHHGLAMQPFTRELSRARLKEPRTNIIVGNTRYQPDLSNGTVVERGPAGEKRYPIAHTMGGKNVFYFLTPLERGRLQVLPVAYDVRRQEWFDMAASAVRHLGTSGDAPLEWRESPFTFNTACFNCHVSQLSKNYDLETDSYHTTWAEPGINCETCHGPGAEHVRLARSTPKGKPMKDLKLIATSRFTPDQMNDLCGTCHAKVYPLTHSFPPGARLFDHFGMAGVEQSDWYPDGRDLGENFTLTSWRMSPCLKSGILDCSHCHTSSGRYRFQGETANNACLPCHEKRVQMVAEHSHHKPGTHGAMCVSCHMPMTEFARMRRSDHSMRPPTPAATIAFGSPNACNLCHEDKDAAWADRTVREWHAKDYQAPILERGSWIAAARKQDWSALPAMVQYLASPGREEIWAASLLQLLRPCSDERKWQGILPCLKDASPLVRAAALDACSDQLRPDTIAALLVATRDPIRLVRIRAASGLAAVPADAVPEKDRGAVATATTELMNSLLARPDDAGSHYNLGNYYMERQDYPKAIEAFEQASRLQPHSVPPLVNVSLAYSITGQNEKAKARLQKALRVEPTNAVANLNFGMLMAELGKPAEAAAAFRTAFANDTNSAAAAYNLGVLLANDQPEESLTWCRRAAELRPDEPKYPYTLAYFLTQRGRLDEAIQALEKSLTRAPAYPESYMLLGRLYESQGMVRQAIGVYQRAVDNDRLPEDLRRQFATRLRQLDR